MDDVDATVDGFAPYVVGTFPLGDWFEVHGRLGYYFYDATVGVEDGLGVADGGVEILIL